MKSDYEERRKARINGLHDAAIRHEKQGEQLINAGDKALSLIPFGQPILIGHHSESRDRNYRNNAVNKIDKGIEEKEKAKELSYRAYAAANNNAISSDNPEAISLLEEKIKKLTDKQEKFKLTNKLIKKNDKVGLKNMGLSDQTIEELFKPDFCGRVGIPAFELTNNNANIKRLKDRLKLLKEKENMTTKEIIVDDITIVESVEDNRVQIFFPSIPQEDIRDLLKSRGFHYSHNVGAWVRQLNNSAIYAAFEITKYCSKLNSITIYDGSLDKVEA